MQWVSILAMMAALSGSEASPPVVLFLGDSLTDGYNVPRHRAHPALIEERLRASGFSHRVLNAGISGDTSADGLRRLDRLLREPPDVLVISLGANDGLRDLPPAELENNLSEMIRRTRAARPDIKILLTGMKMSPFKDSRYARTFDDVHPRVARQFGVPLMPFLLEGVVDHPGFVEADGLHPTADGQRAIAENLWPHLRPLLTPPPPSH